jgi:hypothetical protein
MVCEIGGVKMDRYLNKHVIMYAVAFAALYGIVKFVVMPMLTGHP